MPRKTKLETSDKYSFGSGKVEPPINRDEWDFSDWDESEIRTVLKYEYARSSTWIRDIVVSVYRNEISGKTVQQHLIDGTELKLVLGVIESSLPKGSAHFYSMLINFLLEMKQFPAPWSAYKNQGIRDLEHIRFLSNPLPAGMLIFSPREMDFERWTMALRYNSKYRVGLFALNLEANTPLEELKEMFSDWVKKERGEKKSKRGNGGDVPPWHKVKALAAYRLSEAGLSYDQAQDYLSAQPIEAKKRAWPFYTDKAKWSQALKMIRREIAVLEKEFGCPGN